MSTALPPPIPSTGTESVSDQPRLPHALGPFATNAVEETANEPNSLGASTASSAAAGSTPAALPQRDRKNFLALVLAFAAVYLIWGSTYLAIQVAVKTLPPFLMAGFRFMIAGAILYIVVRPRSPRPTSSQWRVAALVGGLFLLGGNGLVCLGQQYVPSGLSALLVATLPIWMSVLNWLFFSGPVPTWRTIISIFTGLVGLACLLGASKLMATPETIWYAIAVLAAPISWAFGSLRSRHGGLPKSLWLSTAMQMLCGGAMLTLVGLTVGEAGRINPNTISWESIIAWAYLIIFGSLLGFSAFVWLVQNVEPDMVATYAFVNPVVAVLLGWLFAGEILTPFQFLGMFLVVGAVAITVLKPKRMIPVRS